jgi:predicted amidohydrolase YtcJ
MKSITIPLLHDHHNHPSLYAALSGCSDISAMDSSQARAFLDALPENRFTIVRGWKTNELPLGKPELARLPPVLLINFSLHGFAVSDAGVSYLEELAPELAAHRDDSSWCEGNEAAIFSAYCDLTGVSEAKLAAYLDSLIPLGMGSTDDMAVSSVGGLDAVRAPAFASRIYPFVPPTLYRGLDDERRDACAGIKLFLDGAIGSRSAAVKGPWIGEGAAFFVYRDEELTSLLAEIAGWGKAVSMHAIGDLAVEQALRSLETLKSRGLSFPLVRLEHVQLMTLTQAFRLKSLGVTLSMQPNFSSDSRDYTDRLPSSYLQANNPFRAIIDEVGFVPGKDLIFGSDGMPNGIAYAATEALFPDYPGQRLSIEELVAGYGPSKGVTGRVTLAVDEDARRVTVAKVERDPPKAG